MSTISVKIIEITKMNHDVYVSERWKSRKQIFYFFANDIFIFGNANLVQDNFLRTFFANLGRVELEMW